jgi:hypothetical protein
MTTLVIGFALGILSMVVQSWWAQWQNDRRTRRRIARALIPDLRDARGSILGMGGCNKWDSVEMPATKWAEHQTALSEAIRKPEEWVTISGVFDEVGCFAEEAERHEWPAELSDTDAKRLHDLHEDVRRALDILHRYAGVPEPPKRLRQIQRRARRRERLRALRSLKSA